MLVLQREVDQEVVIIAPDGTEIVVMLVAVRDAGRCRLGFTAPRDYAVYRREVLNERLKQARELTQETP